MFGFYRIAAAVNRTHLANPERNAEEIEKLWREAEARNCAVVLFPELSLTGYSCGDLFLQPTLIDAQNRALRALAKRTENLHSVALIGVALSYRDRLYNGAAIVQGGRIRGIVPKSYIPNKNEYYEKRHFNSGKTIRNAHIEIAGETVPFGTDLLFCEAAYFRMGVEICEDLWAITPPSNALAASGATLLCNLSASDELIGKSDYRAELVRTQSARCMAAYAYVSAGTGESTTDMLFGGDAMIAEYGTMLARGERFARTSVLTVAEVDLEKIAGLRLNEGSFADAECIEVRSVSLDPLPRPEKLTRYVDPHPFVPSDERLRARRCDEIVSIQAHALLTRMERARIRKAVVGISGGLDSTLALLSTKRAFDIAGFDSEDIVAITMPGFGTTSRTRTNAERLCRLLGVDFREIDITEAAEAQFAAIGHDRNIHDVTYENVQARLRTALLMNTANKENGLVVGTGDLSEIALGWSTYNGDHMSMYALNAGIPKTLVRYLVAHFAKEEHTLSEVLHDILDTPVSPELLPHENDAIVQETESLIGPYELHDFYLYHFVRYGASPEKIVYLASHAFAGKYDEATIRKWLALFLKRFFAQQFKRSCMPDGPKVGTIALSPRADWRMPSDADVAAWLEGWE